ncbi:hypothetical protein ACUWC4_31630, partial [Klebsiella pneumoniae]
GDMNRYNRRFPNGETQCVSTSVASFAWFIRWFGRVVPGKPSEAVADAAPLPGSMRLVLIVLIVMSLISSVIAATWLQ